MMEYINFPEYVALGGVLSEADFGRAYRRARAELDSLTLGRLRNETTVSESVKACIAELVDVCAASVALYGSPDGVQAVSSVGNDGVSVSYATASVNDWHATVYPNKVREIVNLYLGDARNSNGEQLLYRGCGR
jgi:hypothetical protein